MRRSLRQLTPCDPETSNVMKEMLPGSLTSSEVNVLASEKKLIRAAQLGDQEAFGVLFEHTKDAVYAFVLKSIGSREDAEDIVQEAYCRAWRSIGRFRGDSKLLTWLFRIAANLCVDYARARKRRAYTATETEVDIGQIEAASYPDQNIENGSINRQIINEALQTLASDCRMLIILCDIQGFTCNEAAQVIGCSAVSARVRLSRTRKKLRKLLVQSQEEVQ